MPFKRKVEIEMKNLISIIGRLGRDPECKYSQQGRAYGNFRVAVDDSLGDEKRTTWFTVKVFNKTAENCNRYLRKGDLVHVNGSMYNDTWTDEQGIKKNGWYIMASSVDFLNSKNQNNQDQGQGQYQNQYQSQYQGYQSTNQYQQPSSYQQSPQGQYQQPAYQAPVYQQGQADTIGSVSDQPIDQVPF